MFPLFVPPQFNVYLPSIPNGGQLGGPISPSYSMSYIGNLGNIIRSLLYKQGGKIDVIYSDSLRNIDFIVSAVDLFAFDIHRGRLNGIPNYYKIRKLYYKYPKQECNDNQCDLYFDIDPYDLNNTITIDI